MADCPLADSRVSLLPLTVPLPASLCRVAGGGADGEDVLAAVEGSAQSVRVLLVGMGMLRSGIAVTVSSTGGAPPPFSSQALLLGGAAAVADANLALAPAGLSVAARAARRGGASAPGSAPSGPEAALSAVLLRELDSVDRNRVALGSGQFCRRACAEVMVWLRGVGMLPEGEASLRFLLHRLVPMLSLGGTAASPLLPEPLPWQAFCCLRGCSHFGCCLAWPLLRAVSDEGDGAALARQSARLQARDALLVYLRDGPPPPPPPCPTAAAPSLVGASAVPGDPSSGGASLSLEADAELAEITGYADSEALSGIGGDVAPACSSPSAAGSDSGGDGGESGSGDDDMVAADAMDTIDDSGGGSPEAARATPTAKRRAGVVSQTTGPSVPYGHGPPHLLPRDVRDLVPFVGVDPSHWDLGAIVSVRPLPWGTWPRVGEVPAGSKRGSAHSPALLVGSAARQGAVSAETAAGEACASPAVHAAVSACGGFGEEVKFFDVVSLALKNRGTLSCSLVSISFLLRRLAVSNLLHKLDADGRTLVFTFFMVN